MRISWRTGRGERVNAGEQTGLSGDLDYDQTGLYSQAMTRKKSAEPTKLTGSARDRLLAAANELFYAEGIHTVGIDRVIERAGVAKASLYSTFGSKDELVRAYLKLRADARRKRITERLALHVTARDRILSIFELLGETARDPAFRGCAFVNATAEGPREENRLMQVCSESRAWMLELFTDLALEAGIEDATRLGRQLALLYDGALIACSMESGPDPAEEARSMAAGLIDAHTTAPSRKARASPALKSQGRRH
jgi:AcrR family transcriptional regulator